jgi:hypothetical protein
VNHGIHENLSDNLKTYISEIVLCTESEPHVDIPEHKHECQGGNWPAIFPSEIVLAGRVLIKSLTHRRLMDITKFTETLVHFMTNICALICSSVNRGIILWLDITALFLQELSHKYTEIHPESKLELHIYSIILLCCLQHSYGIELPLNGVSTAQVIILLTLSLFLTHTHLQDCILNRLLVRNIHS